MKAGLTIFIKANAIILILIVLLAAFPWAGSAAEANSFPAETEIRQVLADRVQAVAGKDDGIGIVAGLIGPEGRKIISDGHRDQGDARALDGDSVFEIGSVTKVFTALLLADMIQRGEVGLTDPVEKYLPNGTKLPMRDGRPITLLDLVTHTSGLPFMSDELRPSSDGVDRKSTDAALYRFLAGYRPKNDGGSQWDYSNIGYWLLSQALAAKSGTQYEDLLQTRVLVPLKLDHTAFVLSPNLKTDAAVGHNASLQQAPPISADPVYGTMPAAGLLYSTVNDLLSLISVAMGYQHSSLSPAMSAMLTTHRPMSKPGFEQALGWVIIGDGNDRIIFHDGGTFGFASAVAWDPVKRLGVVVLSNGVESVSDLAQHLLRPNFPLKKPVIAKRIEISLTRTELERIVGRYEAAGEGIFEVNLEGDFLTFQAPPDWGLPKLRLRPESSTEFFAAELPLRVKALGRADGLVDELLITPPRGQHVVSAKRTKNQNYSRSGL